MLPKIYKAQGLEVEGKFVNLDHLQLLNFRKQLTLRCRIGKLRDAYKCA